MCKGDKIEIICPSETMFNTHDYEFTFECKGVEGDVERDEL